jgi:hypothetical protein
MQLVQQVNLSSKQALKLIYAFFGPNTELKMSLKRNQDLFKALSMKIEEKELSALISHIE